MANPIFEKVLAMGPLDEEWSISEQSEEHIIFKGAFGHAEVRADGTVVSKVGPYVAALEAAIRGEELPVKPKVGRSQENKAIMSSTVRNANGGQMRPFSPAVRDIQVAELTFDDIKTYICPAANDQEVMIFLKLCQARNLNPFLRDAYLIKYDQTKPAQMVVGKDAFTKKAEDHPKFDGYKAGIVVKNPDSLNGLDYREGTFLLKGEELLGGWAEVYRSDRKATPYKMAVSMGEYSTGKSNWVTKPATMIRKVALVQALREAFPSEFSGMYDGDEVGIDPEKEVSA